jgi:hypothetical protein
MAGGFETRPYETQRFSKIAFSHYSFEAPPHTFLTILRYPVLMAELKDRHDNQSTTTIAAFFLDFAGIMC